MNAPDTDADFAERRRNLAAQIARQRAEFSQAYAKLEQPLRYTEYGLRGVGFLRSNPWVFAAAPAAVSIIKTLLSGETKRKKSFSEPRSRPVPEPIGFRKTATKVIGHGWKLFQLYRRVRSYLP